MRVIAVALQTLLLPTKMNASYFSISVILCLVSLADIGSSQPVTSAADSVLQVEIDTEPPDQLVDVAPNGIPDSSGGGGSHGDSLDHMRTSTMRETPFTEPMSGWNSELELSIHGTFPYQYTFGAKRLKNNGTFILDREDIIDRILSSNKESWDAIADEIEARVKPDEKVIFKKKDH